MEKGSRRSLDLLRCPLGRKGVADFPPLRVCQAKRYANNEKDFQNFEFSFRKPVVLFRSLYSTVCSHMEPSAKLGSPNWTLESKS